MEVGVQVGALVGHVLPGPALGGLDEQDDHQKQGDARHDDKAQAHVAQEHEHGDEDQVEDFQHEVDDAVGEGVGHGVYIIYDPVRILPWGRSS